MKDILPIGSVVQLKEGTKKIMVIGYLPMTENKQIYDYNGCIWPEGVLSSDRSLLFNHDQVSEVLYIGYKDGESNEFISKLNEVYEKTKSPEFQEALNAEQPKE